MSLLSAALLLVRALPPEPALLLSRLIVIFYLTLRRDCRQDIAHNYRAIFGLEKRFFWIKNGWTVGRNIFLMARIGTEFAKKFLDRVAIYRENNSKGQLMGQNLQRVMTSFHFGLWEYLPHIFARMEGKETAVSVFVGEQRNPSLAKAILKIRQGRGVTYNPPRYYFSLKELVSCWHQKRSNSIRRKTIIGFMLDNTSRGKQVDVKCSLSDGGDAQNDGEKGWGMLLPVLPFRLSKRLGCGVIPLFCYLKRDRLCVRVFASGDESNCFRALLSMIRERPEEWIFWGKRLNA